MSSARNTEVEGKPSVARIWDFFFLYFLILSNIGLIFGLTAIRHQVDFFVELSVANVRLLLNYKLSM